MRRLISILALAMACIGLQAQNPLSSTFGLGEDDRAAVTEIRYRMARIRKHRPTVALVLSGGGAKGAATVGALKFMEQYKLPIDMVVGTSVGGLLGGFYAMGYDVAYLDTLVHTLDWDKALSDKVDLSYIPYNRRRYKEKYMLSFPFFYKTDDYQDFLSGDIQYGSARSRQLHIGADNKKESLNELVSGNLLGSLPSGFVYGQNVNHIIASRTVGYSDSTDFFKLPIPFACVATDMASGRAKVWHSGSLPIAMRSTMSIPGLFAPVRTHGMVLVDGGMRNNFPVNIAREMGADIVIGIDLSTESLKAGQIRNLADMVWAGMDLFSNDAFEQNIESVDLRIHPELEGFGMMSFNQPDMDQMFKLGYEAARQKQAELEALRRRLGTDTLRLRARPAVDIGKKKVHIAGVEIMGVTPKEAQLLKEKMIIKPGALVDRETIEAEVSAIYGKGVYDFVNYALLGKEEPYTLRIMCKHGPMNQLGLSARVDSEDLISLLLNVGLNTHSTQGSSLDLTARLSMNPYLEAHYAYNAPRFSTFNALGSLRYTDRNSFISGTNHYNIAFLQAKQELYFSNMHWSRMDVKLGLQNNFLRVLRVLATDVVGDYDISSSSRDYPGAFIEGRLETLDDGYFPHTGVSGGIRYEVMSRHLDPLSNKRWFSVLSMDGMMPITVGNFSLIPQASLRFIFGSDIPVVYSNVIGGDLRGRYVDQQIPFVGIDNACFRQDHLIVTRMDARWNFAKNHYAYLMGNFAYDFDEFVGFQDGTGVLGLGLGYGFHSIAGPFKAQLHWSSVSKRLGLYLSFGMYF